MKRMRVSPAREPKQKKIQGISNRMSWPIKLSCQCKSTANTRNQKSTIYIFFFS